MYVDRLTLQREMTELARVILATLLAQGPLCATLHEQLVSQTSTGFFLSGE